MAKVAIVVPCYNNFEGLAAMIASVQTKHDWWPIVKDNWRNNRGCAKAWNEGIAEANAKGCDYILVCNDDILFSGHTIDALVEEFDKQPKEVVMLSAVNVAGMCPSPEFVFTFERQPSNYAEHPDFSCFMIRPDMLDQTGPFDENIWPAYFEDNDMHRRIQLLGLKALCTSGAAYYHVGSVSVQKDTAGTITGHFEKNKLYFIQKWGGEPTTATYQTPYNDPNLTPKDWLVGGPGGVAHV